MKTSLEDTYARLIALLDQHGVQYRLIDHAPEGRTELVSAMRGNTLSQAAKCIVLMVKIGKKITKYILAVVYIEDATAADRRIVRDGAIVERERAELIDNAAVAEASPRVP